MNDFVDSRRTEVTELCQRCRVRRLDAFGSVVSAGFDARSDLDFIVQFEPLTPAEHATAYFALKIQTSRGA
jgi:uncharacterized protein